jgi:putative peptide zinc metalloprotease protein
MARPNETFSESWHRVASQRIALSPGVRVRRQTFRGERFYVLEDPLSNQFFRLRPAAYEFVARLRRDRTVDQAWQECLERFPDEAPGQEAALRLLGQLYQANLLHYDRATDTDTLFQRFKKRTQRELKSRLTNIMFFRIPLVDPDRFLVWAMPMVGPFLGQLGALIWLTVVTLGLKTLAENWTAALDQYQGVLAPANLPFLYLALILLKTLHELGHAFLCRKYGGEVHTLGVLFMIFTPVPYVDVTSSWGFRSRWQRVVVGLGGMLVELFVAAIAVFVWANTGPGTLHGVAYNVMFIASVSTLLFNLNPLLRFDGYYILSDLLGIPNLAQLANRQLRHVFEHHLFGVQPAQSPARTRTEASWLFTYGITSGAYRLFVFAGILLAIADRYLLLGIIMLATCAVAWVATPLVRLVRYLGASPRLDRVRPRAIAVVVGLATLVIAPFAFIPFPNTFTAIGIIQAVDRARVVTESAGRLEQVIADVRQPVRTGDVLLELANPELGHALEATQAALAEVDARLRQTLTGQIANRQPLEARRAVLADQQARLEQQLADLRVTARLDGLWSAPGIHELVGRWLPRGSPLGLVLNPARFEFVAVVQQADADRLFRTELASAQIRLHGQTADSIDVEQLRIVPGDSRTLPTPILGWLGGGDVPTEKDDREGRRTAEPFFEVRASLPSSGPVKLADGQSGRMRFRLPPQPILQQGWRRFRQLLQQRYQW